MTRWERHMAAAALSAGTLNDAGLGRQMPLCLVLDVPRHAAMARDWEHVMKSKFLTGVLVVLISVSSACSLSSDKHASSPTASASASVAGASPDSTETSSQSTGGIATATVSHAGTPTAAATTARPTATS